MISPGKPMFVGPLRPVPHAPEALVQLFKTEPLSLEEVTALDLADRAYRLQAKRAGRSEFAGPPAVFTG